MKTNSHLVNALRRRFRAYVQEIDRKLRHLRAGEALLIVTRDYPSKIDRRYGRAYALYTEKKSGGIWETIVWAQ